MAVVRKVKFPLEMKDGVMVTTIQDLRDNFDIEQAIGYFLDGKLIQWLESRYYEEEAEAVANLDKQDADLGKKLCAILGVEYVEEEIDVEAVAERNERIARLKQYTDDEEIIKNIDNVAFNQEELADLYVAEAQKIYLCEGEFNIPQSKQELEYVIVGQPEIKGLSTLKDAFTLQFNSLNDVQTNCAIYSYATDTNENLGKELYQISNRLNFIEQKVREGEYVSFDTFWDSSYRFVFKSDARKASINRCERMEREYKQAIEKYGESIAEKYLKEITANMNQYIKEVRVLLLKYNKKIENVKVKITLSQDSVIELVMTDTIVSKETQEKILKYMKDICKTESKKISYCPLLFTSVDGSEVYDGESIFGRSKFVTKYKYEIDNILDVLEKLHETQNELTSTIFIKQIPNSIYKKITEAMIKEIIRS